jgi:hypothetical protein
MAEIAYRARAEQGVCLVCGFTEGHHTTDGFCDYTMAPGDKPERYTPQWHAANPYADDPTMAREWEIAYWKALAEVSHAC